MLTLPWVLVTQGYTLIKLHRNLKAVHSTIEAMKKKSLFGSQTLRSQSSALKDIGRR